MVGQLIKLVIVVIVIMIGLKIFAPDTYDSILGNVSDTTGIEKSKIDNSLEMLKEKAAEQIDNAKEAVQ